MDRANMTDMTNRPERRGNRRAGRPHLALTLILAAIMTLSIGVFIGKIMEYNEKIREGAEIERRIRQADDAIDALEHEYAAETDDAYIESVARDKLDLVGPDEIIVYGEAGE